MGAVVVLAFTAALNPTELAATTVMMLLPRPERLLFGYWLGAMLTGMASGAAGERDGDLLGSCELTRGLG